MDANKRVDAWVAGVLEFCKQADVPPAAIGKSLADKMNFASAAGPNEQANILANKLGIPGRSQPQAPEDAKMRLQRLENLANKPTLARTFPKASEQRLTSWLIGAEVFGKEAGLSDEAIAQVQTRMVESLEKSALTITPTMLGVGAGGLAGAGIGALTSKDHALRNALIGGLTGAGIGGVGGAAYGRFGIPGASGVTPTSPVAVTPVAQGTKPGTPLADELIRKVTMPGLMDAYKSKATPAKPAVAETTEAEEPVAAKPAVSPEKTEASMKARRAAETRSETEAPPGANETEARLKAERGTSTSKADEIADDKAHVRERSTRAGIPQPKGEMPGDADEQADAWKAKSERILNLLKKRSK